MAAVVESWCTAESRPWADDRAAAGTGAVASGGRGAGEPGAGDPGAGAGGAAGDGAGDGGGGAGGPGGGAEAGEGVEAGRRVAPDSGGPACGSPSRTVTGPPTVISRNGRPPANEPLRLRSTSCHPSGVDRIIRCSRE